MDWAHINDLATLGEFVLTMIIVVSGGIVSLRKSLSATKALRDIVDELKDELHEMQELQIDSVEYIVALIEHIDAGGTPETKPPIPHRLRAEVLDELRARSHAGRAARNRRQAARNER